MSDITAVNTGAPSADLVFTFAGTLSVTTSMDFQGNPAQFNIVTSSSGLMAVAANSNVNNGSAQFVGFAADTISAGNNGEIIIAGTFNGIALAANEAVAGAPLYVSASGGSLTSVAPSSTGNVIFQVGIALTQGQTPRVLIQPQFIAEVL